MLSRRTVLVASLIGAFLPAMAMADTAHLNVVVGSSLIDDIVLDLTASRAKTLAVIPGSACPGHTDVKASDMMFAAKSDLILLHGFQRKLDSVQQLLHVAKQQGRNGHFLSVKGAWSIPQVNAQASEAIAQALKTVVPKTWVADIDARLKSRLQKLSAAEVEALKTLQPLKGKMVIAAEMQSDFAQWTGLHVVSTYGSSDSMSPKVVTDILKTAKGQPVIGVVENMQSGAESGKPIASELKLPRCVLSNFPRATEDTPDYFTLLQYNVRALKTLVQ